MVGRRLAVVLQAVFVLAVSAFLVGFWAKVPFGITADWPTKLITAALPVGLVSSALAVLAQVWAERAPGPPSRGNESRCSEVPSEEVVARLRRGQRRAVWRERLKLVLPVCCWWLVLTVVSLAICESAFGDGRLPRLFADAASTLEILAVMIAGLVATRLVYYAASKGWILEDD
jgi:hypothetical protein